MVIFFLVSSIVFNVFAIFMCAKVRKINKEIQKDLLEQNALIERVEKSKFQDVTSNYHGAIKKI